jgi:hypothetical protein
VPLKLLTVCVLSAVVALTETLPPFTDSITASELRGAVSFLASDALQGRGTPSPGLEAAAAYIASEFRADDLESPTGGDYSQYADFVQVSGNSEGLQFSLFGAGEPARSVPFPRISVESLEAAHLTNEAVFKWAPNVKIDRALSGQIVMLRAPSDRSTISRLEQLHPDAIVILDRDVPRGGWRETLEMAGTHRSGVAILEIPAMDVESIFDRLPTGETGARASLTIGAPTTKPLRLRNMIGILRGSDPRLREQYILVSAHYDHLGASESGIYSGANDNASGVAAVVALAKSFSGEMPHPKRTLIFVAFFGEEKGLLGSTWFAKHPPVPLNRIVADINFEQLGDIASDTENDVPAAALGVTGYSLSDLPQMVSPALSSAGVTLRDTPDNQSYFGRSDNYPLAQVGIPSHTFVAAYEYPDYHSVSDKWQKLNYDNMARLTKALAVAIESLADHNDVPHWMETPKAKVYLDAWRAMHR